MSAKLCAYGFFIIKFTVFPLHFFRNLSVNTYIFLISARPKVKAKNLVLKSNIWSHEVVFCFINRSLPVRNTMQFVSRKTYSIQQKIRALVVFNEQICSSCISCVFICFSEWKGSLTHLNIFSYFRSIFTTIRTIFIQKQIFKKSIMKFAYVWF